MITVATVHDVLEGYFWSYEIRELDNRGWQVMSTILDEERVSADLAVYMASSEEDARILAVQAAREIHADMVDDAVQRGEDVTLVTLSIR